MKTNSREIPSQFLFTVLILAAGVSLNASIARAASGTQGSQANFGTTVEQSNCPGMLVCVNGTCTCGGVVISGPGLGSPSGPCIDQEVVRHPFGGGRVSVKARVEPSVFVSEDSSICDEAVVTGEAKIVGGSILHGKSRVHGRSILEDTHLNAEAVITDSYVSCTALNGRASVSKSRVWSSALNGDASISGRSEVVGCTLKDSASIRNAVIVSDRSTSDCRLKGNDSIVGTSGRSSR